jgi:hypothetical protein
MATSEVIRPPRRYRHVALLWHDVDEFLSATVPFITDGLALDEPVMVATTVPRTELLRSALGPDRDRVHFVDMAQLGRNPARIIPAWRDFVTRDEHRHRPLRGIGEPIWAGRRPEEIAESQLHEALLNVAVAPDVPLWLLCPYDVHGLDSSVIEEAGRSHPNLLDGARPRGSEEFGGHRHADELFTSRLPELGPPTREMYFSVADIQRILAFVTESADVAGLSRERAADFAVAVQQLALSSLRRGALGGVVRLWSRTGAFVCEVHDHSSTDDTLTGRQLPPRQQRTGVWFANQVCDLVQLRSTTLGTTVRVHQWLESSAAGGRAADHPG